MFWELDWHSAVEYQKQELCRRVDSMSAEDFGKGTLDELAKRFAAEFALEPPTIFPENIEVSHREVEIDISGARHRDFSRRGPHYMKGTAIDVRLPFEGDKEMFRVKPSTFNYSPPRGQAKREHVEFTIQGVNLTKEQVKAEIDERVMAISEYLNFQAKSIGNFPNEIRQVAYQALEQRQKKLHADTDMISGLGYRVRE